MIVFALIGAKALYLLFVWLLSAAIGSWMSDRKGYGERVGLAFGMILSAIGLLIVLLLPGRPGSKWKTQGWLPRRHAPDVLVAAGDTPGDTSGDISGDTSGGPSAG
jgi:hypothetical protein